jgi:putative transcriptional regulator
MEGLNSFQEWVKPEKGVFLVAGSDMTDPRFHHSVVLLLAHGEDGTLGLIINRATEIPLSEVLPDLESPGLSSHLLFFGGPVGLNGLLFLIRSDTPPERANQVMEDVYFSGDPALLEKLLDRNEDSHDLRVYAGRAGWAPGQLEGEIARGSWGLVRGNPHTVFEDDGDDIWRDLSGPPDAPKFIVRGRPLETDGLITLSPFVPIPPVCLYWRIGDGTSGGGCRVRKTVCSAPEESLRSFQDSSCILPARRCGRTYVSHDQAGENIDPDDGGRDIRRELARMLGHPG